MAGHVIEINLASQKGEPTVSHDQAQVVAGQGLAGDRKWRDLAPNEATVYHRQITLIEQEQVQHFNEVYGASMTPAETRRNVVTKGIALNDLVDRQFSVGTVRMRGTMLCEPCKYLQKLTGLPVVEGYLHRGGLCAEILNDGVINVGDQIVCD